MGCSMAVYGLQAMFGISAILGQAVKPISVWTKILSLGPQIVSKVMFSWAFELAVSLPSAIQSNGETAQQT